MVLISRSRSALMSVTTRVSESANSSRVCTVAPGSASWTRPATVPAETSSSTPIRM